MRKYFRPELIISLVVAVVVGLLWIGLDAPLKLSGTSSQQTAKAAEPPIFPAQIIAVTKVTPQTGPAKTPTGASDGGYHFQLSEPPLPYLDNYGSPDTTGQDDIKAVRDAMGTYLSAIPENERPPTGSNAEFTRVLSGDNPLHIAFIPQTHIVNGELTDRWGTPLFFHYVSGNQVDITSAGPDQKFWTSDDVTSGSGK